ncbi:unnamed protein product [Rhizophagus irregularis]|nr:unnamed protein product [Rhizophagus irregularis]
MEFFGIKVFRLDLIVVNILVSKDPFHDLKTHMNAFKYENLTILFYIGNFGIYLILYFIWKTMIIPSERDENNELQPNVLFPDCSNTLITLTFILKRKAYFETNYIKYYLTSFLSE